MRDGFTWQEHEWDEEGHERHKSSKSQHNESWRAKEAEIKHARDDACDGGGAALAATFLVLLFHYFTHGWKLRH